MGSPVGRCIVRGRQLHMFKSASTKVASLALRKVDLQVKEVQHFATVLKCALSLRGSTSTHLMRILGAMRT